MKRWLVIISMLMLVGGCATRQVVAPPARVAYPTTETFQLKGRAAIKYQGGSEYIRFTWEADENHQKVYIHSPIGTHVAVIDIGPDQAVLRQGKMERRAADAEQLMEQLLNWHLPIKGLHYWLLGLADTTIPAQWTTAVDGWLLSQLGWQMHFSEYVEVGYEGRLYRVPKRIVANHPGLAIHLVIDDWQLGKRDD